MARWAPTYTTTNSSKPRTRLLPWILPVVAVSLDTVDEQESQRIDRTNLCRVFANFEYLAANVGPQRVIVLTVGYGQDQRSLQSYLWRCGVREHVIQPQW